MEITQQKFIGLSLWVMGYFLELIFGGQVRFTLLSLLGYALSLSEVIIMRYQRPEHKLAKLPFLNFGDIEVRMMYAKAKLAVAAAAGLLYGLVSGLMVLF
jgi:hypothetical protein